MLTEDNATYHLNNVCFYINVHISDRTLLLYTEAYIVDQGHKDPWEKNGLFLDTLHLIKSPCDFFIKPKFYGNSPKQREEVINFRIIQGTFSKYTCPVFSPLILPIYFFEIQRTLGLRQVFIYLYSKKGKAPQVILGPL